MPDKTIKAIADIIGGDRDDRELFDEVMMYLMINIDHPTPENIRTALNAAPDRIVEYLGQDKWFSITTDPKIIPVYSHVAREILLERTILGGTERK